MVILNIIQADLLSSKGPYIAQQSNCVTKKALGLSAAIEKKFPYANHYKTRTCEDVPGTIKICRPQGDGVSVICMFAQYGPGKPKKGDSSIDRIGWFVQSLDQIVSKGITQVDMPHNIGCGLAGGDWETYKEILEKHALKVTLYKI